MKRKMTREMKKKKKRRPRLKFKMTKMTRRRKRMKRMFVIYPWCLWLICLMQNLDRKILAASINVRRWRCGAHDLSPSVSNF